MPERRVAKERRKTVREALELHSTEDRANFNNIALALKSIEAHIKVSNEHMAATNTFMASLSWLSDISQGTQLLKKPSLWLVAFVIGLVALFGGLKAILAGIISVVIPK